MGFDFDEIIDRHGTGSLKWDFAKKRGMREDALPMWVADMDFCTAPCISEALEKTAAFGIYGYTNSDDAFDKAVCDWYEKYFGYRHEESSMVKTPGVVFSVAAAIRAFTKEGDGVLIQPPVYYLFSLMIRQNKRKVVNNPLRESEGRYEIDFEDLEEKIVSEKIKLFIFCSPHNPVGRVWTAEELKKVYEICKKHSVVVVSDEIHCDFTYPGFKHYTWASIDEDAADNSIVLTSPSKTFNLAGLQYSTAFVKNPDLREKFKEQVSVTGYEEPSIMGLAAARAAYTGGHEWLKALKEYILENLNFMRGYLEENIPDAKLIEPEGSYLIWVDLRKTGCSESEISKRLKDDALLWLDTGGMFGKEGEGFVRFNIACPRTMLEDALNRFSKIFY